MFKFLYKHSTVRILISHKQTDNILYGLGMYLK